MSPLKIIKIIRSTIGLILFGYYKSSSAIPIFDKKVTIEDYMFFLKKTTINSWDELKRPTFVDGIIDQEPYSNTRITSDLNFNDKIYMTLTQNKEKFEYWIDFEQKDGVIKFVNISTGNNFGLVTWNLILTIVLIYISIYFDFYLILVACLIIFMRLYTFMIIRNSNILLKLHLEYIFKIYFIKLKTGVIV